MTRRPTTSKLLLVAEGRTSAEGGPAVPVRRYRLARIVAGNQAENVKPRKQRRA
jgi:hypothetical protein